MESIAARMELVAARWEAATSSNKQQQAAALATETVPQFCAT
jgi:hypothetical protein